MKYFHGFVKKLDSVISSMKEDLIQKITTTNKQNSIVRYSFGVNSHLIIDMYISWVILKGSNSQRQFVGDTLHPIKAMISMHKLKVIISKGVIMTHNVSKKLYRLLFILGFVRQLGAYFNVAFWIFKTLVLTKAI